MKDLNTLRIAIVIGFKDKDAGIESIMTHFVKPEKLNEAFSEIQEHKYWIVTETYLADQYGQRL